MNPALSSPFTPECWNCQEGLYDADHPDVRRGAVKQNWGGFFYCDVNGGFRPICTNCNWLVLVERFRCESPPSSRKRFVQSEKIKRLNGGENERSKTKNLVVNDRVSNIRGIGEIESQNCVDARSNDFNKNRTNQRKDNGTMIPDSALASDWITAKQVEKIGSVTDVIRDSFMDTSAEAKKRKLMPSKFGERLVLDLKKGINDLHLVSVNVTSLRLLCEAWGQDELKFKGKKVKLTASANNGKAMILIEPV